MLPFLADKHILRDVEIARGPAENLLYITRPQIPIFFLSHLYTPTAAPPGGQLLPFFAMTRLFFLI
jgi:hypothetical protein